jgi:predicted ester cyclase
MKKLFVFSVVALLALSACQQADNTAETEAMIQSFVEEVWNQGNLDKIDEMVAADYFRHNPKSLESIVPPEVQGLEAFKAYVENVRTIYPDFKVDIEDIVVGGDKATLRWTISGTHKDYNKQINVGGISITRIADGKLAEEWVSWDTHGVTQQLGMVSESETTMK